MVRYIFSINAGRSGSHYLSQLFKMVEGCRSTHEPKPVMNGSPMREYLRGNPEPIKALMAAKLNSIETIKADAKVYVETNHCFIKGFGWLLPECLRQEDIGVIILKRDKHKIAESLLRVGCSPFNRVGRDWIITPEASQHLFPLSMDVSEPRARNYLYELLLKTVFRSGLVKLWTSNQTQKPLFLVRYELAMLEWYVDVTMKLGELYRQRFSRIRFVETELNELNQLADFQRILNVFGLQAKPSIQQTIGKRTNPKSI